MGEPASWVYAVVPADAGTPPRPAIGVAGEPLRLVAAGRLAAVVGSVDLPGEDGLRERLRDPRWLERAARRHHEVVTAYTAAGPAAPLRLATVYRDDDRVREVLRSHAATLAECLAMVAGRVEWGVQAYAEPAAPAPTVPAASPGSARPGTAYLQRRRAEHSARQATRARTAAAVERIHATLAALAAASTRQPPPGHGHLPRRTPPVLNASYLVDHDRGDGFQAEIRRLDRTVDGLCLRTTGPWPAYSFVEIDSEGDR